MISVVLVDDHAVVRSGIRLLLDGQDDIEVIGEAGNAQRRALSRSGPQAGRHPARRRHARRERHRGTAEAPQGISGDEGPGPLDARRSELREGGFRGGRTRLRPQGSRRRGGRFGRPRDRQGGATFIRPSAHAWSPPTRKREPRRRPIPSPNANGRCSGSSPWATRIRRSRNSSTSRCARRSRTERTSCRNYVSPRAQSSSGTRSPKASGGRRRLDAEAHSELVRLTGPVEALLSKTRRPIDELPPRPESR